MKRGDSHHGLLRRVRYTVNTAVLIARAKGRPTSASRGGRNTRLNHAQDAALKL
jgi:hypothetical protein